MSMIYFEHRPPVKTEFNTPSFSTREFVIGIKSRRTRPDSYGKRIVAAAIAIITLVLVLNALQTTPKQHFSNNTQELTQWH